MERDSLNAALAHSNQSQYSFLESPTSLLTQRPTDERPSASFSSSNLSETEQRNMLGCLPPSSQYDPRQEFYETEYEYEQSLLDLRGDTESSTPLPHQAYHNTKAKTDSGAHDITHLRPVALPKQVIFSTQDELLQKHMKNFYDYGVHMYKSSLSPSWKYSSEQLQYIVEEYHQGKTQELDRLDATPLKKNMPLQIDTLSVSSPVSCVGAKTVSGYAGFSSPPPLSASASVPLSAPFNRKLNSEEDHGFPPNSIIDSLNADQKAAALAPLMPVAILAPAGSGKTKTLVSRIAHCVDRGLPIHETLVVTFSKKAVQELRERLSHLLSLERGAALKIYNFHQLALRILRQNVIEAGFPSQFNILSESAKKYLLQECYLEDVRQTFPDITIHPTATSAQNEKDDEDKRGYFDSDSEEADIFLNISEEFQNKGLNLKAQAFLERHRYKKQWDAQRRSKGRERHVKDAPLSLLREFALYNQEEHQSNIASIIDGLRENAAEVILNNLKHFSDLSSKAYENFSTSSTLFPLVKKRDIKSDGEACDEKAFDEVLNTKEAFFPKLTSSDASLNRIYDIYRRRLQEYNMIAFDDMIPLAIRLFVTRPDVLIKYHSISRYIFVDEFQDVSHDQWVFLRLLALGPVALSPGFSPKRFYEKCNYYRDENLTFAPPSITVVGDDDQSIYSFRGASGLAFNAFFDEFPSSKIHRVVVLRRTYRSTPEIVNTAKSLISYNIRRFPKAVFTGLPSGEKVCIISTQTPQLEYYEVIREMLRLHNDCNYSWSDFAVLARTRKTLIGFTRLFTEVAKDGFLALDNPENQERTPDNSDSDTTDDETTQDDVGDMIENDDGDESDNSNQSANKKISTLAESEGEKPENSMAIMTTPISDSNDQLNFKLSQKQYQQLQLDSTPSKKMKLNNLTLQSTQGQQAHPKNQRSEEKLPFMPFPAASSANDPSTDREESNFEMHLRILRTNPICSDIRRILRLVFETSSSSFNEDKSFQFIINSPKRGLGKTFMTRLEDSTARTKKSLMETTLAVFDKSLHIPFITHPQIKVLSTQICDGIVKCRKYCRAMDIIQTSNQESIATKIQLSSSYLITGKDLLGTVYASDPRIEGLVAEPARGVASIVRMRNLLLCLNFYFSFIEHWDRHGTATDPTPSRVSFSKHIAPAVLSRTLGIEADRAFETLVYFAKMFDDTHFTSLMQLCSSSLQRDNALHLPSSREVYVSFELYLQFLQSGGYVSQANGLAVLRHLDTCAMALNLESCRIHEDLASLACSLDSKGVPGSFISIPTTSPFSQTVITKHKEASNSFRSSLAPVAHSSREATAFFVAIISRLNALISSSLGDMGVSSGLQTSLKSTLAMNQVSSTSMLSPMKKNEDLRDRTQVHNPSLLADYQEGISEMSLSGLGGNFSTITPRVSADSHSSQKNEAVLTAITIHKSKGLEWPVVFVIGCNDGVLPLTRECIYGKTKRRPTPILLAYSRDFNYIFVERAGLIEKMVHKRVRLGRRISNSVQAESGGNGERKVICVRTECGMDITDYLFDTSFYPTPKKRHVLELVRDGSFLLAENGSPVVEHFFPKSLLPSTVARHTKTNAKTAAGEESSEKNNDQDWSQDDDEQEDNDSVSENEGEGSENSQESKQNDGTSVKRACLYHKNSQKKSREHITKNHNPIESLRQKWKKESLKKCKGCNSFACSKYRLSSSHDSMHDEDDDDLEEERRIAYVALTRAKSRLYISYNSNLLKKNENVDVGSKMAVGNVPSRFLFEVPQYYMKKNTSSWLLKNKVSRADLNSQAFAKRVEKAFRNNPPPKDVEKKTQVKSLYAHRFSAKVLPVPGQVVPASGILESASKPQDTLRALQVVYPPPSQGETSRVSIDNDNDNGNRDDQISNDNDVLDLGEQG